ncbi:methylsterol monooxygenase 1-like [Diadema antillarum]|uniref:methylsterol monooxygenase 1-like n=2 Tax=Diadema antillarum TaxID=105358 RepID=UPI003A8B3231
MTTHYTRFQISVYISACFHIVSFFLLCAPAFIFQFIPFMDRYKIQQDKPTTYGQQWQCFKYVMYNQFLVQTPLIVGNYFYCQYFNVSFDFDDIPQWYILLAQCFVSLVIEDTWHYFVHRGLHHKSIYQYVHKVHHNFKAPFGMVAEYTHPVETLGLGLGFAWGVLLFGNHLFFIWAWMLVRLLEVTDVHSGYTVSLNPLHLFPFYGGAKFHDFHHKNFHGNYAPTFTWWDKMLGTEMKYDEDYDTEHDTVQQMKKTK